MPCQCQFQWEGWRKTHPRCRRTRPRLQEMSRFENFIRDFLFLIVGCKPAGPGLCLLTDYHRQICRVLAATRD